MRDIPVELANTIRDEDALAEQECFIDARFAPAKGGDSGWVDQAQQRREEPGTCRTIWLPISISTHVANHHEVTLVQLSFDFYMLEAKPQKLMTGPTTAMTWMQIYGAQGVEMIAPLGAHRKRRLLVL